MKTNIFITITSELFMNSKQKMEKMKNLVSKTLLFAFSCLTLLMFASSCDAKDKGKSDAETEFTTRAIWVDPPGFANREAVDLMIEKCQRAGINTILANIMLRGDVYFKSSNFIGNVNANDEFDPLAYVIEKAHAADIKVQAWSCSYYAKPKSPDWVNKPFLSKDYDHMYLSPGHPEVNPYLISVLKELLEYDIDGIHLDYTRYWNAAFDYSDAACNRFNESFGFNPQDFVDNSEKIVAPEVENYPIRVFCPNTIAERVWEMGIMERTMNYTELGYGYITEDSKKIDDLKAPGIIIVSHYTQISNEILAAFERYVDRGGDIVWINPSGGAFTTYPQLGTLAGIKGTENFKDGHDTINSVKDSDFGNLFSSVEIKTGSNNLVLSDAKAVATTSNGSPSIAIYQKDKGHFTTIGFHLMSSEKDPIIQLLKDIIHWHKAEAGITGPDLLAEKRQQWIDWRATHTLELATAVHNMVKEKNPELEFTSAAGLEPHELDAIYRSGGQWLKDGICDYLYPMNYKDNMEEFKEIIENQMLYTPKDKADKVFPGLQLYTNTDNGFGPIDAEMVKQQLQMIKDYGYHGYCLFAYSYFSDEIIEVAASFADNSKE